MNFLVPSVQTFNSGLGSKCRREGRDFASSRLVLRTIALFTFMFVSSSPALASCTNLVAALEALDISPILKPGAAYEEGILSGEIPRELNVARREHTKRLQEQPALAVELSRELARSGHTAGETLFGLDLLTKVNPKLFVDAVEGISKQPGGVPSAPLQNQLSSRMISHLNLTKPEDSIRLMESLSRSSWSRQYLSTDNNAGRALLTAMKPLGEAARQDAALAARLPALKAVVNEWINPRYKAAFKPELIKDRASYAEDMDWAFSRALATQMSVVLRETDAAGSAHYARIAHDLGRVPRAGDYLKNERVAQLFEEFGVEK